MDAKQIQRQYNSLSPFYDMLHHLQTLWADDIHRKAVVEAIHSKPGYRILDIGTGTGLTAVMAGQEHPQAVIVGIDFSNGQIKQACKKISGDLENRVEFVCADATKMQFSNDSFDCVISAYGMGGIVDIDCALNEIKRVAKPDAQLVFAEMSDTPQKYRVRKTIHNYIVEPIIKMIWGFRDLDLPNLFKKHGLEIETEQFFNDRYLGSTTLVRGYNSQQN